MEKRINSGVYVENNSLNLPNLISFGRIALIPFILFGLLKQQFFLAFSVFILAALSDAVDGWLARGLNQETKLGLVLDPLADKLLVHSLFFTFYLLGYVPVWLYIIVLSKDILICFVIFCNWYWSLGLSTKPLWIGKLTTFYLYVFLVFLFVHLALFRIEEIFLFIHSVLLSVFCFLSVVFYYNACLSSYLSKANMIKKSDRHSKSTSFLAS